MKETTKICPKCGTDRLVALRSMNKKVCSTCQTEIPWYLEAGQKPIK